MLLVDIFITYVNKIGSSAKSVKLGRQHQGAHFNNNFPFLSFIFPTVNDHCLVLEFRKKRNKTRYPIY